ncbi:hypothetical protein ACFVWN_20850 [Nocardiopsis flavescens]|uniref:CopG family transcriptional regulator n=1 Tax=Nocardiopsis flavescens TaxID=758803 RepID=A0A1M6IFG6_9ACTN|nr:hypothetical protein [Nocardiopsis flavescens]SHJ33190.1 hypothetical protein SAMN05421803_105131 [Nocardiopsis flavescens]
MDAKRLEELADYYDTHDVADELGEATGHPPVARDDVMIVSSIRLPKATMDRVREAAHQEGVKPTALMRRWIERQLDLAERVAVERESAQEEHLALLLRLAVRQELQDAGLRGV